MRNWLFMTQIQGPPPLSPFPTLPQPPKKRQHPPPAAQSRTPARPPLRPTTRCQLEVTGRWMLGVACWMLDVFLQLMVPMQPENSVEAPHDSRKRRMDCGGKRSATPLSQPPEIPRLTSVPYLNPNLRPASLAPAIHSRGAVFFADLPSAPQNAPVITFFACPPSSIAPILAPCSEHGRAIPCFPANTDLGRNLSA